MSKEKLWFAVDFDGTIVTEAFPKIGEIKQETVDLMYKIKKAGHMIIIWTARSGRYEADAKKFLEDHKIPFDYVNENPEDEFAKRGEQGRKLFAHYYIDDRAVNVKDINTLNYLFENKSDESIRLYIKWDSGLEEVHDGVYKVVQTTNGYFKLQHTKDPRISAFGLDWCDSLNKLFLTLDDYMSKKDKASYKFV